MKFGFGSEAKRGMRSERGGMAVEFAIILPVLALLIVGGMDLGHRYFIQYLTSNASREGARYAAKYTGTSDVPTNDAIRDYVQLPAGLNYNKFNLDNFDVQGDYSVGNVIVTVTVQANKNWWILGSLPGFTNPQTITATTAMNVER
jgi:Flp pilus assembly protein TadG